MAEVVKYRLPQKFSNFLAMADYRIKSGQIASQCALWQALQRH